LFFRKHSYPTLDIEYSRDGFVEFAQNLRKVKASTMIVWGEKDPYLPVKQAYIANSALPNSKVEVMPRCGHAVQSESCGLFNKLVLDFLTEDDAG